MDTVRDSNGPISIGGIHEVVAEHCDRKQVSNAVSQCIEIERIGKVEGEVVYKYSPELSVAKRNKPKPAKTNSVSTLDSILEPLAALEARKQKAMEALHSINEIVTKAIKEIEDVK